ncbi:MAG TPA: DUF6049 family protein [Acidimicrobiales bacterium]
MTRRRRIRARRRAGGRCRSVRLAAAAALGVPLALGAAASPADAAPAQEQPPADSGVTVELVEQPAWVRAGEPFEVRLRVPDAPGGATVQMVVHDRLESRAEFRATLDGDPGGDELTVGQPLPTVPGEPATIGFTPGEPGTGLSGPGVYPVELRALSPGGDVVGSTLTYMSYLRPDTPAFPPLTVAVLVDIAAAPSLRPDGEYRLPPGALARVQERTEVLRAAPGVPLTMAPLPETLEGLARSGPEGNAAVDDLRALAATHPVLARPFVDIDLAGLQRAGLIREANNHADGGANVVRQRLDREPSAGVWLGGAGFGAASARLAVELGIDRAVVPPSALSGADDEAGTPVPPTGPVRFSEGGPRTMVTDPGLAAHLTSGDGVAAAHRFLAELTITWLQAPAIQRGIVVHIPPDAAIEPDVVGTALGALADGQAAEVVPIAELFAEVPPPEEGPATVEPAPTTTADLRPIAPALRSARDRVAGVGDLLDDPDTGASLDQSLLLGTGATTEPGERRAYIERTASALDDLDGIVALPVEYRITLTSRSSTIPVALTNLSEQPLTVRVELEADQLEFPKGRVLTEALAPGTTRIDVPVRTRTSGAFSMVVTVTSPDGSIVLDTSTFDVRSTTISGVGLVLSAGAGLFLVIWWARHWRSSRRSRHLVSGTTGTSPPAGAGALTAPAGAGVDATADAAGDPDYRPAHMVRPRSGGG